jgi:uncharacterized protein (TIGR03437 family)
LGSAGAAALIGRFAEPRIIPHVEAATCVLAAPAQTEGPYWVDEKLNRSDIRIDPSDGTTRPGLPLALSIAVQQLSSTSCGPLTGANIDIWHCDAGGIYSDEAANNSVGKKFLRGYQVTDDTGVVNFTTIYPGWYSGRAVHIHVRIRTYSGTSLLDQFVTQLFFDDAITDSVFTSSPYNTRGTRDTRNTNDMVYLSAATSSRTLLNLTKTSTGYAAAVTIGTTINAPAATLPSVASGGIANAAGGVAGIAPGAWITIYGQSLAASTRALQESDIVNNQIPQQLGGVSVQVNQKAAFMQYVSPSQINIQAPADSSLGSVQVSVTNAAGTSSPVSTTMQAILPALFTSNKYVAAVKADGTVVTSAKSGDVLELYGTGFGPTDPAVTPGQLFSGSAPTTNVVTVTIGGLAAAVSYAGLVAAGLYQINVTVPALPSGDQEVIATINSLRTPSGAFLKIS